MSKKQAGADGVALTSAPHPEGEPIETADIDERALITETHETEGFCDACQRDPCVFVWYFRKV